MLKTLFRLLASNNINLIGLFYFLVRLPRYFSDFKKFKTRCSVFDKSSIIKLFPIITDFSTSSGSASGHYFWQDLIVSQLIFANRPANHLDIGSRIDGLVAHLATFMKVEVLDIRPLNVTIPNVLFTQGSIFSPPPMHSYSSVSCLHVLEHLGLGRYNDPIDGAHTFDGLRALFKLVAEGGVLYISCPVGKPCIYFNAHRVLDLKVLHDFIDLQLSPQSTNLIGFINDCGDSLDINKHSLNDIMLISEQSHYACAILEIKK